MGRALRKLFNLYPGEGRKAGLFLILGFLWSFGAFGALTLTEGLFLERLGASALPASYLITALLICALSGVLLFFSNRLSLDRLFLMVLALVCVIYLLFYLLLPLGIAQSDLFWYILKAAGAAAPITLYIAFWAFIDEYYDLQDAKRCFCLFNAVLYLGDACAGGLISCILERVGAGIFFLIFATGIALSLPLVTFIKGQERILHSESHRSENSPSLKELLRTIAASPFTLTLMLFYFLMQLIVITSEYNYMEAFDTAFSGAGRGHELTAFLGTLACVVSLCNMLFGLFFYSRTVTRFGVNNMILIAPLFFLSLFSMWSWQETLLIALLAFIAREGMSYTLDDNNLLLLISGVPPRVKNQVRIVIESFFEPIGMLVSAALLLLLHKESKVLGLLLSGLALLVVLLVRMHYPRAMLQTLTAHCIRFEKRAVDYLKGFSKKERRKTEFHLLSHLKQGSEEAQLLAYEYLLQMESPRYLPRLLNQLFRFSLRSKLMALNHLSNSSLAKETLVLEKLEQWRRQHSHPSITNALHLYLAKHGSMPLEKALRDLYHPHLAIKSASILILLTKNAPAEMQNAAQAQLEALLHSNNESEILSGLTVVHAVGKSTMISMLFPFVQHSALAIRRAAGLAIAACAVEECPYGQKLLLFLNQTADTQLRSSLLLSLRKMKDESLIAPLLSLDLRPAEKRTLEKIIVGMAPHTATLMTLIKNEAVHIRSRLFAAKILSHIDLTPIRTSLKEIVRAEIEKVYFYDHHMQLPYAQELTILKETLAANVDVRIDFLVQLSALAGAIPESEILSHGIHSKNRKVKARAIETLEKALEPTLFALIRPFIDERQSTERRRYLHKSLKIEELLSLLATSPSRSDRLVAETLQQNLTPATLAL